MRFFPLYLDIHKQPCLVVGGGNIALRKVSRLLSANARVKVVARTLCDGLREKLVAGEISYIESDYQESHLDGMILVIAATSDTAVNIQVSLQAKQKRIPVNVVDNPQLCSFIMPSVINRDPVQIAISTGSASPILARLLRARLETMIPSAYGKLAALMKSFRDKVREHIPDIQKRRRFWEEALQGPITEMLFAGQDRAALDALSEKLAQGGGVIPSVGEVYLVGGGPGDPDLLTFRALRLMQQADVVLYDRLVAPTIVDLARRDADRIYVGKQADQHALPQQEINRLLVKLAKEGKRVLRLKGGDPFIFGRGGEEIETLTEQGVSFQVVPGITAAAGCACYSGIPLTHRDYAQSCLFVTGHMKDGTLDLNWEALVQPKQTVAIYMGVGGIRILCSELINHGMPSTKPAAIIQQGTTPEQRVIIGDLMTLPDLAEKETIKAPSMLIIGEVVKLHETLSWYKPTTL